MRFYRDENGRYYRAKHQVPSGLSYESVEIKPDKGSILKILNRPFEAALKVVTQPNIVTASAGDGEHDVFCSGVKWGPGGTVPCDGDCD